MRARHWIFFTLIVSIHASLSQANESLGNGVTQANLYMDYATFRALAALAPELAQPRFPGGITEEGFMTWARGEMRIRRNGYFLEADFNKNGTPDGALVLMSEGKFFLLIAERTRDSWVSRALLPLSGESTIRWDGVAVWIEAEEFPWAFVLLAGAPSLWADSNEARSLLTKAYEQNETPAELVRILGSCNVAPEQQAILGWSRCRTADEQEEVAQLLRGFLAAAWEDEQSGRVKAVQTPFFNMPYQYPTIEARTHLLETLSSIAAPGSPLWPMMLPAVEWVLENEQLTENRRLAVALLSQIPGERADQLVLKLLTPEQPSTSILVGAIDQAAARRLTPAVPALQTLLSHFYPSVRQASAKALQAFGVPAQAKDVQRLPEHLRTALDELFGLGLWKPEPEAQRLLIPGRSSYVWQLSQTQDKVEVLNNDGTISNLTRTNDDLTVVDADGDQWTIAKGEIITTSLQKEAAALIDSIQSGTLRDSLSPFPPQPLHSLAYPVFVAAWALNQGHEELVIQLMQTLLDSYFDEDGMAFKVAHVELAWQAYRDGADAYEHGNLKKAQALFQRIADHFPDYTYHNHAQALARQLVEDITSPPGDLPTKEQWLQQSPALPPGEQVRLLVSYLPRMTSEKQQPDDADSTERIAPALLLEQLGLEAVPTLAKELANGRYLPLVYQSFHSQDPYRGIARVCDIAASVLNQLIHFNRPVECLADVPMDQQKDHIDRILTWYEDNKAFSERERLLKMVESGTTWYEVDHNAWRLVELDAKEAGPVFLKFLQMPSSNEYNRSDILRGLWRLGIAEALPEAHKLLTDPHPQVSVYAGMIVYLYGDKEQGLKTIEQGLSNGDYSTIATNTAIDAVSVLLESKSEREYRIARQVFGRDYVTKAGGSYETQELLKVFKEHRPQELGAILIEQLSDCRDLDMWTYNGQEEIMIRHCDQWARLLSEEGTMTPTGFSFNQLSPIEERDKAINQLKEYLRVERFDG